MLHIYVICVGRLKEKFYQEACDEYIKRLRSYCRLTVFELPEEKLPSRPSQAQIDAALRKEAEAIRCKLPTGSLVTALCVEGRLRSSEELAVKLRGGFGDTCGYKQLVFLIGSSYGLDLSLKAQAQDRLSMSPMTFPHHLARVMLLEQLYRGFKLNEGGTYHK